MVETEISSPTSRREAIRQACDPCRRRKAKCEPSIFFQSDHNRRDETGRSPCGRCVRMELDCTYLLPFGVRGPRSKRLSSSSSLNSAVTTPGDSASPIPFSTERTSVSAQQMGDSLSPLYIASTQPTSHPWPLSPPPITPGNIQNPTFHSSNYTRRSSGEELCSRTLLKRILSDYLEYLYPLIPVVHRPSFRRDIHADRDLYDADFYGLTLSICGATVGTMPNRFKEYTTCATPLRFRSRTDMIRFCYDRLHSLRGSDYFENISFQKWAASYLMGISLFQIGEHNQARMIEVEAMQLARLLGLHQISEYMGLNCIEAQLRKKAFWLMFYGYVHAQYQNLRKERLEYLNVQTLATLELEQLMPLEVDDEYIFEHTMLLQPPENLSLVAGFNTASRIFWTALRSPSETLEDCYCERTRSSVAQFQHLKSRLHDLHYMLDDIPPQLRQWQNINDDNSEYGNSSEHMRVLNAQFATLRANIHVSHIWLQSIITDQVDAILLNLHTRERLDASVPDHRTRWVDREHLCRQLLHVLHSIPDANLEPNGHHLTYKVRDVAVGLFTCPFEPHSDAGKRATEYLREFAKKLSSLDGSEMPNTMSLQSWVDTDRTYLKRTH